MYKPSKLCNVTITLDGNIVKTISNVTGDCAEQFATNINNTEKWSHSNFEDFENVYTNSEMLLINTSKIVSIEIKEVAQE